MGRKHILITGSNGFIGHNFLAQLKLISNLKIYTYTRDSNINELRTIIKDIDIIVHLAGEVRPKSDDLAFKESNTYLTDAIVDLLEGEKHYIPIVMASSIHAQLQKNQYGITKREAEKSIENYAKKYSVCCVNYRLPHVFGEGCKPNYNSVISTWIYNSINNQEIVVFDRDIAMEYVYVQDIIEIFISFIQNENILCKDIYQYPTLTYKTTLGDIVDYLVHIKNNSFVIDKDDGFKSKLLKVYKDYKSKC